MSDQMPRLMFLLLPVFALLLKAFFRDRLYFDHLIFSLHLHSAAFVISARLGCVGELSTRSTSNAISPSAKTPTILPIFAAIARLSSLDDFTTE